MKRRDFFRLSAPMLSTPLMLNSTMANSFSSFGLLNALDCDLIRDRFVVLVQLRGANDGLNTIIRPEFDADYVAERPDVYITPGTLLQSTNAAYSDIRLHPSMDKIKNRCDDGAVNIIQSVGYPVMNRSHFAATDLWLTGGDGSSVANQSLQEGWMGKYLEYIYDGYGGIPSSFMPDPLGIHLRGKSQSLGFSTNSNYLKALNLSIKDSDYYKWLADFGTSPEEFGIVTCDDRATFMQQLDASSSLYGNRILQKFAAGSNSGVDYGNYDLGAQFKTVARLVNGGCRSKIFLTEMTGFDTHVDQLGAHANLMDHLSESVNNFMEDLTNLGLLDRCLIVTFSEFGRKFIDNNSNGTDHGTLAPMMVFGDPANINAGLTGPKIDVTNLDAQGAPVVAAGNHVDYREVFSSILMQWLGANSNAKDEAFSVYDGPGNALDLIPAAVDATPGAANPLLCYTTAEEQDHDFEIVMPILNPGDPGNEPLQEITACDYVSLLPGFQAPCGSNVIIYPLECPPDAVYDVNCYTVPPADIAMATFKPEELKEIVMGQALYIRKDETMTETKLIEKIEQTERVKITMYPNPTVDVLNLTFTVREGENKIKLTVVDVSGRIVPVEMPSMGQSPNAYQVQINVAHLVTGTYYLKYHSEKVVQSFKFVKI